jgi:hypothetical protein
MRSWRLRQRHHRSAQSQRLDEHRLNRHLPRYRLCKQLALLDETKFVAEV